MLLISLEFLFCESCTNGMVINFIRNYSQNPCISKYTVLYTLPISYLKYQAFATSGPEFSMEKLVKTLLKSEVMSGECLQNAQHASKSKFVSFSFRNITSFGGLERYFSYNLSKHDVKINLIFDLAHNAIIIPKNLIQSSQYQTINCLEKIFRRIVAISLVVLSSYSIQQTIVLYLIHK